MAKTREEWNRILGRQEVRIGKDGKEEIVTIPNTTLEDVKEGEK